LIGIEQFMDAGFQDEFAEHELLIGPELVGPGLQGGEISVDIERFTRRHGLLLWRDESRPRSLREAFANGACDRRRWKDGKVRIGFWSTRALPALTQSRQVSTGFTQYPEA